MVHTSTNTIDGAQFLLLTPAMGIITPADINKDIFLLQRWSNIPLSTDHRH